MFLFYTIVGIRIFLRALEILFASILFYSGFLYLYVKLALRDKVAIIFCHEVGRNEIFGSTALSPRRFEQQIRFISRWYRCVSIDDMHGWFEKKNTLPPNPLVVTFDGGYRGNMTLAYPILKRYGIPFTIYLTTGLIERGTLLWQLKLSYILRGSKERELRIPYAGREKRFSLKNAETIESSFSVLRWMAESLVPAERDSFIAEIARTLGVSLSELPADLFLTWEDVARLKGEPLCRFGAHTVTHPDLPAVDRESARREIVEPKKMIETATGRETDAFCYPNGIKSPEIESMVHGAGYRSATTVAYGLNDRTADRFALKRIAMDDMPLPLFALTMSGLYRAGSMTARMYAALRWLRILLKRDERI